MLVKVHAAPLEMAQVDTNHPVIEEAIGAQFHSADGFK